MRTGIIAKEGENEFADGGSLLELFPMHCRVMNWDYCSPIPTCAANCSYPAGRSRLPPAMFVPRDLGIFNTLVTDIFRIDITFTKI
jgi:hypothetical protein